MRGKLRSSVVHFASRTRHRMRPMRLLRSAATFAQVMMYCTGGIRCEIFSAKLKASGFKHVYKLQGGVQHYGNTFAAKQKAQAPAGATAKES
eukprot:6188896-Pleurochrysis_carterae.AAC.1